MAASGKRVRTACCLLPCPYLLFGASEDLAKSIGHVRVRTSHANLDKPKAAHTPAAQARRPSMQSFFTKSTFRFAAAMHKGVQPSFAPDAECPNHESLLKQSARLLRWACLSQPGVSCAHQSSWLLEAQQNVAMQERVLRTLQKVESGNARKLLRSLSPGQTNRSSELLGVQELVAKL